MRKVGCWAFEVIHSVDYDLRTPDGSSAEQRDLQISVDTIDGGNGDNAKSWRTTADSPFIGKD